MERNNSYEKRLNMRCRLDPANMTPTGRMFVGLVDEHRSKGQLPISQGTQNCFWSSAARAMGNIRLVRSFKREGTYIPLELNDFKNISCL